jgi:hypothetical protein
MKVPSRALIIAPLVLAAAAGSLAPPTASASIRCRPRASPFNFPAVYGLRAEHTGCNTARAVAEAISYGWHRSGHYPRSFDICSDCRPIFHCAYHYHPAQGGDNPYVTARCVAGRKVVSMELAS